MTSIVFYFQVHQPFRIREYSFFDLGHQPFYEDEVLNRAVFGRIANKCYLPTNHLFSKLIGKYGREIKLSFSLSGMALDQMKQYRPDVLDSFKALVDTGCVELLAETYYHSLASVFNNQEFEYQVDLHHKSIKELFSYTPTSCRNTELIFSNSIAERIKSLGYKATLCEGLPNILQQLPANQLFRYKAKEGDLAVLPRNFKLTDDIAFRFSNKDWKEWPLTPQKYIHWLEKISLEEKASSIHLFIDYETFGEHQWEGTGIFAFMDELLSLIVKSDQLNLATVSEVADQLSDTTPLINSPNITSWADTERDLSAWNQNSMQRDAMKKAYALAEELFDNKTISSELKHTVRKFLTSDHYYYMSTKYHNDGAVHQYFSPYQTPYDAYIYFTNALADLINRISLGEK